MKAHTLFRYGLLCVLLGFSQTTLSIITSLSRNDPIPSYTAQNPFALLGTRHYEYLKEHQGEDYSHMSIEMLPFYQRATRGNDVCGNSTELGDINGRWNMIALLPFNVEGATAASTTNLNTDLPCGYEFPQILVNIRDQLLEEIDEVVVPYGSSKLPDDLKTVQGLLDLQKSNTATFQNFGFFSVPMKYRKFGIRFNVQFYIAGGLGATLQTGFADISQCASFVDLTHCASWQNPFNNLVSHEEDDSVAHVLTPTWKEITKKVSKILMANLSDILSSTQICLDSCDFKDSSIEDLHGEVFWRYPIQMNKEIKNAQYPKFLFIPFCALGGTYAIAKKRDYSQLLGLPFGNDEHSAIRARGGLSLDFYDTIQISFEVGGTWFKERRHSYYPVPNNSYQYPIYPFKTTVCIQPGNNWHMAAGMYAYHFYDNWSFTFNYVYASHEKDSIKLLCNNWAAKIPSEVELPANENNCRTDIHPFKPQVIECKSNWSAQVFDAALTYDISPDFSLGAMFQIPLKRTAAYRSSTFMASLYMHF